MLDAVKSLKPHAVSACTRTSFPAACATRDGRHGTGEPEVLIADEPTTRQRHRTSPRFWRFTRGTSAISRHHHRRRADLGVVAGLCDQVMVLYKAGRRWSNPVHNTFSTTRRTLIRIGLLRAVPRMDSDDEALIAIPGAPPSGKAAKAARSAHAAHWLTLYALRPFPS